MGLGVVLALSSNKNVDDVNAKDMSHKDVLLGPLDFESSLASAFSSGLSASENAEARFYDEVGSWNEDSSVDDADDSH